MIPSTVGKTWETAMGTPLTAMQKCERDIEELRQSIRQAGHFPHEERPEEFNRLLLEWLSQRAPAGADRAA